MNNDLISRKKVLDILHDFGNRFEPFSQDADDFAKMFIEIRDMTCDYKLPLILSEDESYAKDGFIEVFCVAKEDTKR